MLGDKDGLIASLTERLSTERQFQAELQKENAELHLSVKIAETEIRQLHSQIEDLASRLETQDFLRKKLEETICKNDEILNNNRALESSNQELTRKSAANEDGMSHYERQLGEQHTKGEQLAAKLERLKAEILSLEADNKGEFTSAACFDQVTLI